MNGEKRQNPRLKKYALKSAKECAFIAVFVALLIAGQFVLSAVPGVEVVTVLFCSYAFAFGVRRGMAAATAFSFIRQLLFGFFPNVLILYLLYYNLLAATFGGLGKKIKRPLRFLAVIVAVASVCAVAFTALDNVITPLWYGYSARAARAYAFASLPFMGVQALNAAISVGVLFLPLFRAFSAAKRTLL